MSQTKKRITMDDLQWLASPKMLTPANKSTSGGVDQAERCLVTKSPLCTNTSIHWITDPRRKKADAEKFLIDLGIVGDRFDLYGPSNTSNLDCVVHVSFKTYNLLAVTGTSETLKELTKMVKEDNDKRQRHLDEHGTFLARQIDLNNPTFLDPQYELVVLYPRHFLPDNTVLVLYDPAQGSRKIYVPSPDDRLREFPGDLTCTPFPPFSGPNRQPGSQLNPFLVILRAAISFGYYDPSQPLPLDVLQLMKETTELSSLILWKPEVRNRADQVN